MWFSGGIMEQIVKTIATVGAMDAVSKTNTANRILDEAAKRTEDAAKFLEKLEKEIEEEEK